MVVHTADGLSGPVVFSRPNLNELTTHLLNELQQKFGPQKVRTLYDHEYVYPNEGIVSSKSHRIHREASLFAESFTAAVTALVAELASVEPPTGVYVLEAQFADQPSFAPSENMFSDFLYIYARLIKKTA